MMYKLKGSKRILPLIEDAAVPIDQLVPYFEGLPAILSDHRLNFVIFGHIAKGLLHTRPLLDLKGKQVDGSYRPGLLSDEQIEATIEHIIERGGKTKNLYDADGKKIDYYQVNATYFSALGEDEQKLLLARAIQLFTTGIPQVWYLDLFAGVNDYAGRVAIR